LENLMERYYFGDLGMNGRVILKWMRTGFTWPQDRAQSHPLVNSVMNIWVLKSMGNFLTSWVFRSFWRRALISGVIYLYF
jgi:hypothetical protein